VDYAFTQALFTIGTVWSPLLAELDPLTARGSINGRTARLCLAGVLGGRC
jgi:hypothetical protein